MAAHERLDAMSSMASPSLLQQLASALPKDINFKIYHLSTPPTRTSALYSAPPGARPDRTYCESHFLSVSITTNSGSNLLEPLEVLVFAIEILVYSTAYDTTFFVSKADSTGFLQLSNLPKGTPSPLRDISSTFLRHLVKQRQRQNIRSVISLFARAQDQYLFPGSVEYSGKHVLDDRGLVRWWCRVLDPLIKGNEAPVGLDWEKIKGYLVVPGLDTHETMSYLPRATKSSWTIGHPLQEISRYSTDIPPRCLIPHFPDDPKSRYLDELDDEISKGRNGENGQWKSVKTIDQFWDMMAFRQECSAGRLVGFIWIVFTPVTQQVPTESVIGDSQTTILTIDSHVWDNDSSIPPIASNPAFPLTPATSFNASGQVISTSSPLKVDEDGVYSAPQQSIRPSKPRTPKKPKLSGPIIPRKPRIKTENKNYLLDQPEVTAYYTWRPEGRGQVIVDESDYKRITELLLRLDFASLDLASSSSSRWINEVRSGAVGQMKDAWGELVTGAKTIQIQSVNGTAGIATLNMGLMRKKRKGTAEDPKDAQPAASTSENSPAVNVLSAGMIRKKAKV